MRRRTDAEGIDGAEKATRIVGATDRRHHRDWSYDQTSAARAAERLRQIWQIADVGANDLLDRFVRLPTLAAHARRSRIERDRVLRRTVQALSHAPARSLSADLARQDAPWARVLAMGLGRLLDCNHRRRYGGPYDLVQYAAPAFC